MTRSHDAAYNRDEEQKPQEPRMAQEPAQGEGSASTPKTLTDPASGDQHRERHAPNQAQTDEQEGAGGGRAEAKDRNLPS